MLTRRRFFVVLGATLAACRAPNRQPGTSPNAMPTSMPSYTVVIRHDATFQPAALTVPVGSMVAWHHMAESVHTVTADPAKAQLPERIALPEGAQPFDSGDLYAGQRWVHTFDVAGSYTYFCRYHEMDEMLGIITVTG